MEVYQDILGLVVGAHQASHGSPPHLASEKPFFSSCNFDLSASPGCWGGNRSRSWALLWKREGVYNWVGCCLRWVGLGPDLESSRPWRPPAPVPPDKTQLWACRCTNIKKDALPSWQEPSYIWLFRPRFRLGDGGVNPNSAKKNSEKNRHYWSKNSDFGTFWAILWQTCWALPMGNLTLRGGGGYPPKSAKEYNNDNKDDKEDKDDDFDGVLPGRPSCGKWTNHLLVSAQERLPQEEPHFCKVNHFVIFPKIVSTFEKYCNFRQIPFMQSTHVKPILARQRFWERLFCFPSL